MKRLLQILLSIVSATSVLSQSAVPVRYNSSNKYVAEPLPFLAFPDGGIKIGTTTPALINGSAGGLNIQTAGSGTIILNSPTTTIAGNLSVTGTISGVTGSLDPELAAIAAISLNPNQFYARLAAGTGPVDTAVTIGPHFTLAGNTLALANAYQLSNAHLTDLSDGELTGSKVGPGIVAGNITGNYNTITLVDTNQLRWGDGSTAIAASGASDTINVYTGSVVRFTVGPTGAINIPGDVTIGGVLTADFSADITDPSEIGPINPSKLLGRHSVSAGTMEEIGLSSSFTLPSGILTLASVPGAVVGTGISAANITTGLFPHLNVADTAQLHWASGSGISDVFGAMTIEAPLGAFINTGGTLSLSGDGGATFGSSGSTITADVSGVTIVGTGLTLPAGSVSLAEEASINTNKLIGRYSAGSGPQQEIGITSDFTMAGGNLALAGGGSVYQPLNTHLTDLSDGSLTGSKVGTGISATNVTTGTFPNVFIAPSGKVSWSTTSGEMMLRDDGGVLSVIAPVALHMQDIPSIQVGGGVTAGVAINATGAVTISAVGTIITGGLSLSPGVINLSEMANLAQGKIIGRSSASTGVPEAITVSTTDFSMVGGNLTIQPSPASLDADLLDLADGSLTGSKVGTGIDADNITTGTLFPTRLSLTKAQLDTAVTDGNVAYLNSPNIFTANNTFNGDTALNGEVSGTNFSLGLNPIHLSNNVELNGSLTFLEMVAPTTPVAGKAVIYPKSDGKFYSKDDAGTETPMYDTGAGGVTDGIHGDITVSDSGDTWTVNAVAGPAVQTGVDAAMITIGNLAVARMGSGGGTPSGTTFLRGDNTWATPSGGAGVTDGDKGDVSVSVSGSIWTVDAITGTGSADIQIDGAGTSGKSILIGTSTDLGPKLQVKGTSTQQAWLYDASNYAILTVGSTGTATLDMSGTGESLVVSDPVLLGGTLTVTGKFLGNVNLTDANVTFGPSFKLPNGTDPDLTAEGQISYDTNGDVLRAHDGTNQVAIGRKIESIHCTVILPNDLADSERDAFWMWENVSGMSFVVTGWRGKSDTDNTSLNIEEINEDGTGNVTVSAVEIDTNGTGIFTGTDAGITNPTIENNHLLVLDFDDTDVPGQVKMTIYGYYDANVN